jgi:mannosyltransferase
MCGLRSSAATQRRRVTRQLPVAALLAVGLLLRVVALSSRGIWYDDAFSVFLARRDPASIVAGTAADTMPPLYYLLLRAWMWLGDSLASLRMLNVLVSLGTLLLAMEVARRFVGANAAGWAGLLVAISPFQIYHAQELRMYGLLCLTLLGYVYCFGSIYLHRGGNRAVWAEWVGLVLSGALAMYCHNLAVFTIVVADLLALFYRRWRLLVRLLLAQGVMLLLVAPWLILIPGQVAKIQRAFWTPRPGLLELVQLLVTFHTNLPVPEGMIPVALAASVLFLVLVGTELVRSLRGRESVRLLAAFAVVPGLILLGVSYVMRPLLVPRALICSSVVYYVLGAAACAQSRPRAVRTVLALVFVVPALVVLPAQYAYASFPRSPHRALITYLRENGREQDVVLHDNKLSFFPSHFYGPDISQSFLPDEPGSHNDTFAPASQEAMQIWPETDAASTVGCAERLWFVFYTKAREEYLAAGEPEHPVLAEFDRDWMRSSQTRFNDLEVVLYERE